MNSSHYIRKGPLSFCQEMLFHSEILQNNPQTISRIVQLSGDLNKESFCLALTKTIECHEPLRSKFEFLDDIPTCFVLPPEDISNFCIIERSESVEQTKEILRQAYDPTYFSIASPPQMRHSLIQTDETVYLWAMGFHHIAADAMSISLFGETFRRAYAGEDYPASITSSIDYSLRQANWLASEAAQRELKWWLINVENIENQRFKLPVKQNVEISCSVRKELRIPIESKNKFIRQAKEWHIPIASLFYAAFAKLIVGFIGGGSVTFFTNVPSRGIPGASLATGAFYNTLPITVIAGLSDFQTTANRAADALFKLLDHQDLPIGLVEMALVRASKPTVSSRIPFTFNVVEHPAHNFRLPKCRILDLDVTTLKSAGWGMSRTTPIGTDPRTNHDHRMDWLVTLLPSAMVVSVEYSKEMYDDKIINTMLLGFKEQIDINFGKVHINHSNSSSLIVDGI